MNKKAVTRTTIAIIAAVIIIVAAFASYYYYISITPSSAKQELVVGAVIANSGSIAETGKRFLVGLQAWINVTNAEGGIYVAEYGRKLPLRLIWYDDRSDPATSAALAEKLITEDHVDVLFATPLTPPTSAIAPVTEKYGMVFISGSGTESLFQKGYRYLFSIYSRARDQTAGVMRFVDTLRPNITTIAIISLDSFYTMEMTAGFIADIVTKPYQLVLNEKFPTGTTDFTALLIRAKDSNADFLIINAYTADCINIVRQMKQLDYRPKLTWVLPLWDSPAFIEALGEDAEYLIGEHWWHPEFPEDFAPGVSKFVPAVRAINPSYVDAQIPFHACMVGEIWRRAVEQAGSLDQEEIREVLLTLDINTIGGPFRVYSSNFLMNTWYRQAIIGQIQNGTTEVVWPDACNTSMIWYPTPPWD